MYHSAVSPFGGERSEPITRMLNMLYDAESQSRNADFILIARKGDTTTLGPEGRQTYEPSGQGPVNLKNPHTAGVSSEPGPLCGL